MNGQLNVTPIESKQPQAQCEFKIQATLRGFPIEITGSGRAADLKIICDRLIDLGAEPPTSARPEPTKTGIPACPEHGLAKPSKKPGNFYCPKSLPDGGYCRWTGRS